MQTLIVTIEDIARLSEIKTAIERLPGVACVTNAAPYDATDCDAYHEAMDDIKGLTCKVPWLRRSERKSSLRRLR